ncbi:hypothetical protein EDC14_100171 [Hydrogenispora ethanolica]|jgi:hypothetical protein|uniref:Carboxypeptidase regulatory-like domain-containing protein n=1 Tax=Hydrogenispora ethanolica TaxID=1082276 RepID=A0A4R1SBC3_HYDET|nr:hypothetical protein [Hydrogenispora ethanolica]TCL76791.1 hypothetical protein EDC14_100171 [Hydrogenispora ethanolica]
MKNVSKLRFIATLLFLALALAGCSLADPSKPGDSLLIGRLTLQAEGWADTSTGTTVNGTQKVSVFMNLRNEATQKLYHVQTEPHGFFGVRNPEPGLYVIEKLSFKATGSSGWSQLTSKARIPLPPFEIAPGKVTNLGSLCWIANKTTEDYRFIRDGAPEELRRLFAETFPKSGWLQREWLNVGY